MNIKILGMLLGALLLAAPVRAQDDQKQPDLQRLATLKSDLQDLNHKKDCLEADIEALDQKLADTDDKIARLNEEISDAEARQQESSDNALEDPGYSNSGFANPVGKVPQRDTTSQARSRLQKLTDSRDATDAAIVEKKASLRNANRDITKTQKSIRDLKANIAEKQKRMEEKAEAALNSGAGKQLDDMATRKKTHDQGYDNAKAPDATGNGGPGRSGPAVENDTTQLEGKMRDAALTRAAEQQMNRNKLGDPPSLPKAKAKKSFIEDPVGFVGDLINGE